LSGGEVEDVEIRVESGVRASSKGGGEVRTRVDGGVTESLTVEIGGNGGVGVDFAEGIGVEMVLSIRYGDRRRGRWRCYRVLLSFLTGSVPLSQPVIRNQRRRSWMSWKVKRRGRQLTQSRSTSDTAHATHI
jgi:hypothetical protein